MKKIVVFCNSLMGLISFRKELLESLLKENYKIFVVAPTDCRYLDELKELKCIFVSIKIDSRGTNPIKDLRMMIDFRKIVKKIQPDMVLTYTIKPNVYGGYVCSKLNIPYISNVTGLGTSVEQPGLLQAVTLFLYKKGIRRAKCVFFQNANNLNFMLNRGVVKGRYRLIPGSGVNLKHHVLLKYPKDGVIRFFFISRIMHEKGIDEYLELANYIKANYKNTEFHILGACDDEEYLKKLNKLNKDGIIIYHGCVKDVREFHKMNNCTIHPSFYPEGMSNVLLESCASGRPIITTDRPGCKEIVEDGVNGYIIKSRDIESLIKKVEKFIKLSNKEKEQMGLRARKRIEKEFDRNIVINSYLQEITREK